MESQEKREEREEEEGGEHYWIFCFSY